MAAGIRAIRGPDWSGGDQDGGEGHVGTVVQINSNGSASVVWDNGKEMSVKIGQGGKYELRILDNAPIGVRHVETMCDACGAMGVAGFRWKCEECDDFDLCSVCYVTDQHDMTHHFLRIDKEGGKSVRVNQRNKSMKVRAMGIFPGATVVRGRDWICGNQDGGPGSEGTVTELVTPGTSSVRSAVTVRWESGQEHTYRVGQDGKVDLQYTDEGQGIEYYPQHLPALDFTTMSVPTTSAPSDSDIRIGDRVCVELEADALKELHKVNGSWSAGMSKLIGQAGEVISFSEDGSALVQFGSQKYKILPMALKKLPKFSVGDTVRILNDAARIQALQEDHGGWLDEMQTVLGKTGRIVKIDSDGDCVVSFGRRSWLFNPSCCLPATGSSTDEVPEVSPSPSGAAEQSLPDFTGDVANLLRGLLLMRESMTKASSGIGMQVMVGAILQNNVSEVRSLLEREPQLARATHQGLTALHIAAHEGKLDVVKLLVLKGADINAVDNDGDTPLHIAIIKRERAVAEFLIEAGVDVNKLNKKRRQAIHNAAYFGMSSVIRMLIAKGCDLNSPDSDGDAPIFDAIGKEQDEALEALLTSPKINLRATNKKGFTPIHTAAFKGSPRMTEKIILKDRTVVNLKKEDGFTSLHLAAFNNHADVAKILIDVGKADVDSKNHKGDTPLHLSCIEGYMQPAQLLVEKRAFINAKNNEGDTPLHVLMRGNREGMLLRMLIGQPPGNDEVIRVRLGCYLLQHDADRGIRNNSGKTPVDVCNSPKVKLAIMSFSKTCKPTTTATTPTPTPAATPTPSTTAAARSPTAAATNRRSFVDDGPKLCKKCMDIRANALYLPCGHKETCRKCSLSIQICGVCGGRVTSRVGEDGRKVKDCIIQ